MKKETINITSTVLSIFPGINNILISGKEAMSIEEKDGVGDIVTSVDKQIEEYIKTNLSKLFSHAQIISEESADSCITDSYDTPYSSNIRQIFFLYKKPYRLS